MASEKRRGRPRADERSTPEHILTVATRLFYTRGLRHVSLDDIAAAAGLTKPTLYYHFPTKDDLIMAYLARWRERGLARLEADADLAPVARLAAAFKRLGQEAARPEYRGCPFVNAVAELNDSDHPAAALAIAYEEDRRAWFERVLREAGVREAAKLARQLVALWYGAIVRALITRKPSVIGEAAEAALVLVGAARARGAP